MKSQKPNKKKYENIKRYSLFADRRQLKSGQIQSGETITVLVIISILIALGLIFGFNTEQNSINKDQEQIQEQRAISIALKASNLKELGCSEYDSAGILCIDEYKAKALENIIKEDTENAYLFYYDMFRNSEIKITTLYPEEKNITIYNFNDTEGKTKRTIKTPIILMNPVTEQRAFALLETAVYY